MIHRRPARGTYNFRARHRDQVDDESSRLAAVEATVSRIFADRSDPKRASHCFRISRLPPCPEEGARTADHREVVSHNGRWRARWRVPSVHPADHDRSYGCAIGLQDLKIVVDYA